MSYQALYRKFRPLSFDDVKGQDHIVTTLKNQLIMDRVGHAYLFTGTRGTGKTSVAKIFARAVNCPDMAGGNPCNVCDLCKEALSGNSLNVIEIDAASNNGVDNIRDIRDEVQYQPVRGKYKVYIIDEVHMLSAPAFNALLKTLEEPPAYVIFILATTEVQKIPATILSRCQRYDFHRITTDVITDRLTELVKLEGEEVEAKALNYIARLGDGSMRDALSLLDRCISFSQGKRLDYESVLKILGAADLEAFSRMFDHVLAGEVTECIRLLEELLYSGRELGQFVTDFTWYLRNLLLVKTSRDPESIVDASAEDFHIMLKQSKEADTDVLMRYIRVLAEVSGRLSRSANRRVLTEVALIRLCQPAMEDEFDSLVDRIRVLERRMDETPKAARVSFAEKAADEAEEEAELQIRVPKAEAPEDFKKIVSSWGRIARSAGTTLGETLKNSDPMYNGDTGEKILYIVMKGNGTIARLHAQKLKEESKKAVQEAIAEAAGLMVEDIRFVLPEEAPRNLAPIPANVDEALDRLGISVEVNDEPEEDDYE